MAELKIMSWNIQNLGGSSTLRSIYPFIGTVIKGSNADIVGIMEIVGQSAETVLNQIVNDLNGRESGNPWQGKLSDPSYECHNEQYIYLWKESTNLTIDVGQNIFLAGILSSDAFDHFLDQTKKDEIEELLYNHHYLLNVERVDKYGISHIRKAYLISTAKVNDLVGPPPGKLDFGTDTTTLTTKELDDVRDILIKFRNLGILNPDHRTPYIATFQVGTNRYELPIALLHAPNPANQDRARVINSLANSPQLNQGNDGLVMGDFNVKDSWQDRNMVDKIYNIKAEVIKDNNGDKEYKVAFESLKDINYVEKLNEKTSLKVSVSLNVKVQNACLNETYDRFYVKETTNSNFSSLNAEVEDVMGKIVRGNSRTKTYKLYHDHAFKHVKVYNTARTISLQKSIDKLGVIKKGNRNYLRAQDELKEAKNELSKLNRKKIISMYGAFYAFTNVSDHVPILIELTYN
jgi:endonuclease/exonuclease/phosphatase family metal-dependent hydrolase